jgi:hypothetical protein
MQRMIEWGAVQSKDRQAKLIIEESRGGRTVKQAMHKVWVQMSGLPRELSDFITIWAIGTILGVTRDVDMKFTREFDRARLQVLVLEPSLIPLSVDVVIGEYVYELHFRVEPEDIHDRPEPMDMDDDGKDDRGDEGADEANEPKHMQEDMPPQKENNGGATPSSISRQSGNTNSQHGKKMMYHIPVPERIGEASLPDWPNVEDEVEVDSDEDDLQELYNTYSNSEEMAPISEPGSPVVQVAEMAAIPEIVTPGRRSKRRAETANESSLERAERIKAARNMDVTHDKGNTEISQHSFLEFSNEHVSGNLKAVGISLGKDIDSVSTSISNIKDIETGRLVNKPNIDRIGSVFDREEHEEMENEEVDKLILNSLCSEIMEEVMDLGSAYPMGCNTTPRNRTSSSPKCRKNSRKKGKQKQNS